MARQRGGASGQPTEADSGRDTEGDTHTTGLPVGGGA